MSIYVDVVIIQNLIMNFIIFLATSIIMNIKKNYKKMVLASLAGGVFSVLSYISKINSNLNFFFKILVSIAMVQIAFSPINIKILLKQLIIFYLTSFCLGGAAFMLLYNSQNVWFSTKNGENVEAYIEKIAILGGLIGATVVIYAFKKIKGKSNIENLICETIIFYGEKVEKINTILDTGNLLKEPVTGYDVIIVEKEAVKNFLKPEIYQNWKNIILGKFKNEDIQLRIIPYSSIGNENGILLGIKAKKVIIKKENENILKENVVIGIYDGKIDKASKYQGLIGANLLEGEVIEGEFV
jgi:stage II sporulation protein GA (sporulation sigma-E factor processing peptidase)